MENVRIGIIGIGNMGSSHVKWIMAGEIEHLVLTAVADIREERRAWVRETYPDVAVFDDAEALMTSGLVDAVLIATPHYLHPPLAIAALNHGLHVMSEKPAGVYTKAVREENELARKSDKTFAIMFNQRTHCMYRKVKEIIASGELGALRRVNWLITDWFRTQYYYDSGSWRATWDGEGGGVLLNQCPHNLDLLQWMVGMPVRVRAFTHNGKWHNIEVEDDVTAYMEFENGATGVFITSTGDMLFSRAGEMSSQDEAQQFITDNDVTFAVAFGPVMVEDGQAVECSSYPIGEVNRTYSRTAIGMRDTRHYILMTVNYEDNHSVAATLNDATSFILTKGVVKAYALDGGQTSTMVMNGHTVNRPDYGNQRTMSDIIYFATALPEEVNP